MDMVSSKNRGDQPGPPPTLGEAIRLARKAKGWTIEQLAYRASVSRNHVAGVEKGANVSVDVVERLASALQLRELPLRKAKLVTVVHGRELDIRQVKDAASMAFVGVTAILRAIDPQFTVTASEHALDEAEFAYEGEPDVPMPDPGHPLRNLPNIFQQAEEEETNYLRAHEESREHRDMRIRGDLVADAPLRPVQLVTEDLVDVHIVGAVAAGAPIDLLNEGHGETRAVPISEAPPDPEWRVLEARGDSMINFGIHDHDLVYVEPRRGGVAASGEIVIGWLNDGLVIKQWQRKQGRKWLASGNEEHDPREITKDDVWELQAIVRYVVPRTVRGRAFPNISGKGPRRR